MLRHGRPEKIMAGLIVIFMMMAGYVVVLIAQKQDKISQLSNYNIAWIASQTAVETSKFQNLIVRTIPNSPDADADEIQLRFEILVSRLDTLKAGDFAAFAKSDPEIQAFVDAYGKTIREIDALTPRLSSPGVSRQILTLISPFDKLITKIASAAYAFSSDRILSYQHDMQKLQKYFVYFVVGLFVCGTGFIALLIYQNLAMKKSGQELQATANELRQAIVATESARAEVAQQNLMLVSKNKLLKQRDTELHTQIDRFNAALNNMKHGLLLLDHEANVVLYNKQCLELFGLSAGDLPCGSNVFKYTFNNRENSRELGQIFQSVRRKIYRHDDLQFVHTCADGQMFNIFCQQLHDKGAIVMIEDVTERRCAEERIEYLAHHDALTGLANRLSFAAAMETAISDLDHGRRQFAVHSLDLDRFKLINDTYGHQTGDKLLQAVSERLCRCIGDGETVARLGGDEFVMLQANVQSADDAWRMAERILAAFREPFSLAGRELIIGASIGVTLAPQDGRNAERLLKNADLALYRAKLQERGTIAFYDHSLDVSETTRLELELDLRHAIANGELELFYQLIGDSQDMSVLGHEALMRWNHPARGRISPLEFISVAENNGSINAIGEWALREACMECAHWPLERDVSVNVSPVQFRNPGLVSIVMSALACSGLRPSRLTLEITESAFLDDSGAAFSMLKQIKALGVKIALDDFGTGYSSLSYLRKFPFDKVKIDKSFVDGIASDPEDLAIVRSIVDMCRTLGMAITAEGVENATQLECLRRMGCNQVQGYFLGRPVASAVILLNMRVSAPTAIRAA